MNSKIREVSNWRELPAPTHRCKVCGALWRFWSKRDTPNATEDTWNMRSNHCGPCCDTAPMGEQIVPVTEGDMLNWLQARLALEQMMPMAGGEVWPDCGCKKVHPDDECCRWHNDGWTDD